MFLMSQTHFYYLWPLIKASCSLYFDKNSLNDLHIIKKNLELCKASLLSLLLRTIIFFAIVALRVALLTFILVEFNLQPAIV